IGLVGLAQRFRGQDVHYLLTGQGDAAQLGRYGVSRVYQLTAGIDEYSFSETLTDLVNRGSYSIIITPVNRFYRTAVPMTAQRLSAPLLTDVIDVKPIDNELEVVLNGIGNRAQVTVKVTGRVFLMAPPARFKPSENPVNTLIEPLQPKVVNVVKVVSMEGKAKGGARIEDAELIVAVGRGFRRREDLKLAFELAEVLGAEVGCSRPIAADLKWLSEDHWIGLSGHRVRPRLYIAIGISGQPQHLAGMMESRTVVVINNDPNAPFFRNCDYGVVEDLYSFIPALTRRLRGILKR
ncbi:MAG: electron transfer flavoprotein subunit alpha/FixB family protein, partial [Caldivirga sp.]